MFTKIKPFLLQSFLLHMTSDTSNQNQLAFLYIGTYECLSICMTSSLLDPSFIKNNKTSYYNYCKNLLKVCLSFGLFFKFNICCKLVFSNKIHHIIMLYIKRYSFFLWQNLSNSISHKIFRKLSKCQC